MLKWRSLRLHTECKCPESAQSCTCTITSCYACKLIKAHSTVDHDAGYRTRLGIPPHAKAIHHSPRLQIFQHSDHCEGDCQDRRFWPSQSQAIDKIDGPQPRRDCELASTRTMDSTSKIQSQGRRFLVCNGLLGNASMACPKQEIPLGGV